MLRSLDLFARGVGCVCAAAAAAILLPMPTFALWMGRYAALETSLVSAVAGYAAAAWLFKRGGAPRAFWVLLALASAVVATLPSASALWALRGARCGFTLAGYAGLGAVDAAAGDLKRDLILEPSRPDLVCDVYRGKGTGTRPFVIVVHGGSWRGGDKGQAARVSQALADHGWTVIDARYRLAPRHQFPAAIGDVKCLLGRVREQAARLGVDPSRAVLLGRSAGGQIALVAAYSAGDTRLPPACAVLDTPVQGVVALYAPTDLAWGHANPIRPDVVRGPESLELYLGGPPVPAAAAYRLATPQTWVDHPLPPTLLVHGTEDRLVSFGHAERLAAALAAAGRRVRLVAVPAAEHAFDLRPGGTGEQLARCALFGFLDALLP
jgi:acetyl esterase/lipase